MRRRTTVLAASLFALLLAVPAAASASGRGEMLAFETMAPVSEPFTGTANPIRDLAGGGLPWEIDEAEGKLHSNGKLEINVEGLVLARRAPVPPDRQGVNPSPSFKAIVSCVSTDDTGAATTVNVETGLVPATASGDARISTTVDLPDSCIAPVVFVTSPTGAWFSATGR
ncbi:hypothetical protein ABN028_15155 [Actinopolymorpha sp. B17G11]|uniref:hypothetical protein n=1 Tax=unclassified Actinopolymorpha TaxID=2627063 RepID=UPI0032D8D2FE